MSYETYHIPVNFTDAGKLFGVFEICSPSMGGPETPPPKQ